MGRIKAKMVSGTDATELRNEGTQELILLILNFKKVSTKEEHTVHHIKA